MIVIFGGTGTLGHALAKQLKHEQVTIISRCELKQKNMAKLYPQFRYIVGDVRDDHWKSMVKPTEVFNLAAMKHVDVAESNVAYCYDVNFNGTKNTCDWAVSLGVPYNFMSTDKAVLPINAYGASKFMAEKYVIHKMRNVFKWGNILGSRGSVLHLFKESLLKNKKVYITCEEMTRFFMHIDDAATFMLERRNDGCGVHIPEMGAAKIVDLARCVAQYLNIPAFEIEITGIRPGEKIHEVLHTGHDWCMRSDDDGIRYSYEDLYSLVVRAFNG